MKQETETLPVSEAHATELETLLQSTRDLVSDLEDQIHLCLPTQSPAVILSLVATHHEAVHKFVQRAESTAILRMMCALKERGILIPDSPDVVAPTPTARCPSRQSHPPTHSRSPLHDSTIK